MLVYTVGTFDLLHVGHLALLEYCSTLGDVAVGVASDNVVNSYKPNVPIILLEHRVEMLRALSCVSIVRPYYELEYVTACKELDPDIFIVGEELLLLRATLISSKKLSTVFKNPTFLEKQKLEIILLRE